MNSAFTPRNFCIVGPIQAHGKADHREPQGYRTEISQVVLKLFPDCAQFHPDQKVTQIASRILNSRKQGDTPAEKDVAAIKEEFLLATNKVGSCELVVGYLPLGTLSMGTAMELYAAHLGGAHIVLVSENIENLALVSTVSKFVPDVQSLERYLRETFFSSKIDLN